MSAAGSLLLLLLLLVFSLIAPIAYLSWVRRTERYYTEAWGPLLKAFAYGAFIGTFVSAILELISLDVFSAVVQPDLGLPNNPTIAGLVLACVIAPFIEEGMKGLGAWGMRDQMRYVADGLVFGAAVGFGFSFIENLLYGVSALSLGVGVALATIVIRSFSSSLLHGSATAMTGLGVAENQLNNGRGHALAGYYLLAVLMHASFNLLASLSVIVPMLPGLHNISSSLLDDLSLLALLAAVVYAFAVFGHVRTKITEMQFQSVRRMVTPARVISAPAQPPARYRPSR
jgi:protease PrsW